MHYGPEKLRKQIYLATCLSVRSFARTPHWFACSTLLALLARSAGLFVRLLTHFALYFAGGKVND